MLLRLFPAGIGCLFAVILFGVAGTVFWIWALIDCATKEPNEWSGKVGWILIILLTHFLGALLYVLIRRPERLRQVGR
ncbi:MAG TPA: PLD nuclease N-terminal domain-containing protein [Thermoanaerobaculia bacterium]|jgi:sterol desaturase/sphingolipid hydroxylase (fatty acid hydroxylase superfamily)